MISRLKLAGLDIEFADEGSSGVRPAVVLLHGFAANKDTWLDLRSRLMRERRVISVDLPGFGGSERPVRLEEAGMDGVSAVLERLFSELDLRKPIVVGYSLGGRIALHMSLTYPQKVGALVLVGASAGLAAAAERAKRRREDEELAAYIETHSIEEFVGAWESQPLFESQNALPVSVKEAIRAQRLECTKDGLAMSLRGLGVGAQPWLGDRLSELAMPVLIVTGSGDTKFMKIGKKLEAEIARAQLMVAEGVGHAVHLEVPKWFHSTLSRFIGAVPGEASEAARLDTGETQCR